VRRQPWKEENEDHHTDRGTKEGSSDEKHLIEKLPTNTGNLSKNCDFRGDSAKALRGSGLGQAPLPSGGGGRMLRN